MMALEPDGIYTAHIYTRKIIPVRVKLLIDVTIEAIDQDSYKRLAQGVTNYVLNYKHENGERTVDASIALSAESVSFDEIEKFMKKFTANDDDGL